MFRECRLYALSRWFECFLSRAAPLSAGKERRSGAAAAFLGACTEARRPIADTRVFQHSSGLYGISRFFRAPVYRVSVHAEHRIESCGGLARGLALQSEAAPERFRAPPDCLLREVSLCLPAVVQRVRECLRSVAEQRSRGSADVEWAGAVRLPLWRATTAVASLLLSLAQERDSFCGRNGL
jgi:hypothetical protein